MENAFSLSPNPNFLYQNDVIKQALHKLRYVVNERQGLTGLIGEPGLGKSSVLRLFISELQADENYAVIFVPTPSYATEFAFLKGISAQLEIPSKRSHQLQEAAFLNKLLELAQAGKHAVLLIDEAQRLPGKQLEITRTLINFETDEQKLITVVFAAQMELYDRLKHPSKKALRSRIIFPTMLSPLSLSDTSKMIEFRCKQAEMPVPFPAETIKEIYEAAGGNPRDILKIAAAAYQIMMLREMTYVPAEAIASVVKEARLNYD